jgi:hypothetical protein
MRDIFLSGNRQLFIILYKPYRDYSIKYSETKRENVLEQLYDLQLIIYTL